MRVLLDVQPLQTQSRDRGIGRYVRLLALALARRSDVQVVPVYDPFEGPAPLLEGTEAPVSLRADQLDRAAGRADVYHVSSPFEEPGGRTLFPLAAEFLVRSVTLHDVIPFEYADRYFINGWTRRRFEARAQVIQNADVVLSVSADSARKASELIGVDPSRMQVVGEGSDPFFQPEQPGSSPKALREPVTRPYVFSVGSGEERKNIERLIRAFSRMEPAVRATHQLVIACRLSERDRQRWDLVADQSGLLGDELILTGGIDDDELRGLYRNARLFVMPSWAEGFGLPALEAAACGCPVLTSTGSALPEILDFPESTFDPFNEHLMSVSVQRGLTDESFRSRLHAAGRAAVPRFNWDAVAERVVEAWTHTLAHTGGRPRPPTQPRIALVGPFLGSATGIGAFDSRLCDALRRRVPTVGFVDRSEDDSPWAARLGAYPALALGRSVPVANFHHVVYALGNSAAHRQSMELALTIPGHVWLHEASLAGYHLGVANRRIEPHMRVPYLRHALNDAYGTVLPGKPRALGEFMDADRYQSLGLRLLAPVVARARSVIVSSDEALDQIHDDVRYPFVLPPMTVIPLAFPCSGPVRRPPTRRVVGVVGWPGAVKDPVRVLEALRGTAASIDQVLFVGPAPDDALRSRIDGAALACGLDGKMEFAGYLSPPDYADALAGLRLAVQLRSSSNGEMSAAIADLLAAGTPVLTNLGTEARFASDGLFVGPADSWDAQRCIRDWLVDDATWTAASIAAQATADSWTFDDVAAAVVAWLESQTPVL